MILTLRRHVLSLLTSRSVEMIAKGGVGLGRLGPQGTYLYFCSLTFSFTFFCMTTLFLYRVSLLCYGLVHNGLKAYIKLHVTNIHFNQVWKTSRQVKFWQISRKYWSFLNWRIWQKWVLSKRRHYYALNIGLIAHRIFTHVVGFAIGEFLLVFWIDIVFKLLYWILALLTSS